MLSMDFEEELNKILASLPANKGMAGGERRTFLFSATMTSKVAKLQRASLHKPIMVCGLWFVPCVFVDVRDKSRGGLEEVGIGGGSS
jgi:superfamily II DNA/RNA helicase